MAVNVVRDRKIVVTLLWITVVCIGLKGVLLTFRRYVTLHGLPLPDQGVGMHEEAFFFNAFVLLLLVLTLCRILPRLRWLMWSLLPFVALGNLALNRRTATAAMIVLLPLLIMAAYQALPERRRVILGLSAAVIAGLAIYYPLFKKQRQHFRPARPRHPLELPTGRPRCLLQRLARCRERQPHGDHSLRAAPGAGLWVAVPARRPHGRHHQHLPAGRLHAPQPDPLGLGAGRHVWLSRILDDDLGHPRLRRPDDSYARCGRHDQSPRG